MRRPATVSHLSSNVRPGGASIISPRPFRQRQRLGHIALERCGDLARTLAHKEVAAGEQAQHEPAKRLLLPGEQRVAIGVLIGEPAVSRDLRAQRRPLRRAVCLASPEVIADNRQHQLNQFRGLENVWRRGAKLPQMRDELGIRGVVYGRPGRR